MNKKLFSWKALAGLALLVAMGLTSCKQDNVIDPENPGGTKPSTDPTSTYVISGDDIAITALKPSDISEALTKLTAAASTRAAAKTYNVSINAASMKVTDADKTIVIPEVTDATWNITFDGAYAEDKAILVIKDDALDFVNIALPEAEFKGFDIETPYSTVSIEGVATIGELVVNTDKANVRDWTKRQTIGARVITLGDGIYVKGLNYVNGGILLEDGAEIGAYIAGLHPNNGTTNNQRTYNVKGNVTKTEAKNVSIEEIWFNGKGGIWPTAWDNAAGEDVVKYEVYDEAGNVVFLKNLIIRAVDATYSDGATDYTDGGFVYVGASDRKHPIDWIQVEDGARVRIGAMDSDEYDNYTEDVAQALRDKDYNEWYERNVYGKWTQHYWINSIEGLGNGTGVVSLDNDNFGFKEVKSVKNITVDNMEWPWDIVPDAAYINGYYGGGNMTVYSNLEKVTFKNYTNVTFQGGFNEVKASKFPVANRVLFNIDASDAAKTYAFNYNACEFLADAILGANALWTDGVLLDENGEPITYTVWDYAKVSADGKSYVNEQTQVYNNDGTNKTDKNGADVTADLIDDWSYVFDDNGAIVASDAAWNTWEYVNDEWGNRIYFKDGKYSFNGDEIKIESYATEWVYNAKIDYTDIPLLARKDGMVNSREVYAMENQREINDMNITVTLTGSKLGGKAISKSTSMIASQPQYFNGNNQRFDAKMTYRYDIDGVLYRNAYDNVGKKWIFIKAN